MARVVNVLRMAECSPACTLFGGPKSERDGPRICLSGPQIVSLVGREL